VRVGPYTVQLWRDPTGLFLSINVRDRLLKIMEVKWCVVDLTEMVYGPEESVPDTFPREWADA
jgi:hypothetical protein